MSAAERIAALRARIEVTRQFRWDVLEPHILDHIEDVLGRHTALTGMCRRCRGSLPWPCLDAASALSLLDQLDGGTDD